MCGARGQTPHIAASRTSRAPKGTPPPACRMRYAVQHIDKKCPSPHTTTRAPEHALLDPSISLPVCCFLNTHRVYGTETPPHRAKETAHFVYTCRVSIWCLANGRGFFFQHGMLWCEWSVEKACTLMRRAHVCVYTFLHSTQRAPPQTLLTLYMVTGALHWYAYPSGNTHKPLGSACASVLAACIPAEFFPPDAHTECCRLLWCVTQGEKKMYFFLLQAGT